MRELGSVLKSIGLEPEPQQLQRLIDIADTDKVISHVVSGHAVMSGVSSWLSSRFETGIVPNLKGPD